MISTGILIAAIVRFGNVQGVCLGRHPVFKFRKATGIIRGSIMYELPETAASQLCELPGTLARGL